MIPISKELLYVFMSLFKGRQDVFAIRWEKDSRSGYMPAYDLNWDEFAIHKANGGTLRDFANKSYSRLQFARSESLENGKAVTSFWFFVYKPLDKFLQQFCSNYCPSFNNLSRLHSRFPHLN